MSAVDHFKNIARPSIFILILMVSVGPFGDTEYTPSMTRIAHELGVTYNMVQLTMTSYLLGYALSQLFYGPLSDRFGRRPLMLSGASIFTFGTLICYLSFTIHLLIFGRFIQALGSCAGGVLSSAAVRDSYPEEKRGRTFAIVNGAFSVAPALGPIVGSFVDHYFGWHANFLVLLFLAIILFVNVWFFFPETNHHKDPTATHIKPLIIHYFSLFRDPYYLPYLIVMGLAIGVVYSCLIDAPVLVIKLLHLSSKWISIIALGVMAGFMLGSFITSFISGKIHDQWIVFIGTMIMIVSSLVLGFFAYVNFVTLASYLIPICTLFAGIAFVIPPSINEALLPFEHVTGSASAMLGFFQMGIASLSTGIASIYFQGTAWDMPITFMILSVLAQIVLFFGVVLRPNRKRAII